MENNIVIKKIKWLKFLIAMEKSFCIINQTDYILLYLQLIVYQFVLIKTVEK